MVGNQRYVKVYTLKDEQQWVILDTGYISSTYEEGAQAMFLLVRSKSDDSLIDHKGVIVTCLVRCSLGEQPERGSLPRAQPVMYLAVPSPNTPLHGMAGDRGTVCFLWLMFCLQVLA